MCGIAGVLLNQSGDNVRYMVEKLSHRGPDGHGIQNLKAATLGHVRLTILDVEARVPFLDVKSVALALGFPPAWKLRDGRVPKHLLRQTFASDLPAEIVNRPKQKFSEGAGSSDLIAQVAESEIPNKEFQRESHRLKNEWDYNLQNKESLFYYKTMREFFDDKWIFPTMGESRSL